MIKQNLSLLIFLSCIGLVILKEANLFRRMVFCFLKRKTNIKQKKDIFWHSLFVIMLICFSYGYFVEPYWLKKTFLTITTEKLTDSSFRIIHLSDLHCDNKVRLEKKLVEVVNSYKPDIIVFTGDSINSAKALKLFKSTISNMKAKSAKLAVSGNFESWFYKDLDLFSGTGFELIDNKSFVLNKSGETISFFGLAFDGDSRYPELLAQASPEVFNVLLFHTPDLALDLKDFNVDLYLCGHTHGGQVALPFYGAIVTLSKYGKRFEAGKYKVSDMILYVSSGIGMEGGSAPRVRFFARPEVVIIDIIPQKK